MSFSYTSPSNSNQDAIRFLIRDTDSASYDLEDAEIAWLLTQEGNIYAAAVEAAYAVLAKYKNAPDIRTGVVHIKNANRVQFLEGLIERLRLKASTIVALPYAGGISRSDKQNYEDDDDRVKPAFTRRSQVPPGDTFGSTEGQFTDDND